jgi:Protein of unknown function (DUF2934)
MPLTSSRLFDPLRFVERSAPPKAREALVAEAAYFRAQRRGFVPGHEDEDWLAAEAEIDRRLLAGVPRRIPQ